MAEELAPWRTKNLGELRRSEIGREGKKEGEGGMLVRDKWVRRWEEVQKGCTGRYFRRVKMGAYNGLWVQIRGIRGAHAYCSNLFSVPPVLGRQLKLGWLALANPSLDISSSCRITMKTLDGKTGLDT